VTKVASGCAISLQDVTKWQGARRDGSPAKSYTGTAASCVSNACLSVRRRVPHDETSWRAGCRKIGTSGSMSKDGKRGDCLGLKLPRPSLTLPSRHPKTGDRSWDLHQMA
jgi:hypothetical protein